LDCSSVYLEGVDGELWTNHGAEFTVDTFCDFTRRDFRVVVPFGVCALGFLQHLPGAEVDAEFAPFAALWNQVNLAQRQLRLIKVNGSARKDSHVGSAAIEGLM
jgi:hypothetical protein